ncbi:MAG: interleukin-like EMT inducer domain-containing protein [Anaerolineae bacterium]
MKQSIYTSNLGALLLQGNARTSHAAVLILYLALAILLTWPTVTHLDTHLPGDGGDDPAIAWNLWWVKYALLVLKTSPLYSDYLFYPIGINLAFYTLTVFNALTALPLTLNLGVVAASNLHMWFAMSVGAYGTFLLVRQLHSSIAPASSGRITRHTNLAWGPAIFAGLCYAFSSSQLFYLALGQFNIASSHWVPYVILCVYRSRCTPNSIRWPLLAALFLALQLWTEMTYASFSIVFIVLYAAYEMLASLAKTIHQRCQRGYTDGEKVHVWPIIRNVSTAGIFLLVSATPLLAAMLPDLLEEGDFWVQGSGFAEVFSADLLGFLVPTMRHPFLGELIHLTDIVAFDKGQHIYVGITLLVLAMAGVLWGKKQRVALFWTIAVLLFAWLTLGPLVHINGASTGIAGPFAILQTLPFFKGNRYPSRYSVFLMLSLAVLAARGIVTITNQLSQHRITGIRASNLISLIAASVFLVEHLSLPLPQSDMQVPKIYTSLADASIGSLLDIPFAWRNGFRITGPIDPSFMFGQFYQTAHHQRLLQGNTSRNPAFKFQYFTEAPVLNSLLALETGHIVPLERWEADRLLASDVLRFFDIRYIVVRQAHSNIGDPSVTPEATIPYIEAVFPVERVNTAEGMHLYRVNLPPLPRVVEVNPFTPLARLYLGEGWSPLPDRQIGSERLLWAQRTRARLLLPLKGGPARLVMRLYVPGEGQRITIQLDGWRSEWSALAPGWNEHTVQLPEEHVRTGLNEIWLHFEKLYPVDRLSVLAQLPSSELHRLWYTEYGNLPIVVQSAGEEVGDFAHIYLGGRDVALNERGYNVAVLERSSEVRVAAFDTHLDRTATHRLTQFLAQVPQNTLVVVAAADEASMYLDEAGVAALRTLGATGDIRGRFRWSHAIIGMKGGAPGTALEAMDGLRPITLALGAAVSSPSVAAGIIWLRCESD